MNLTLLFACIGMITGFFILLSLTPTEFTDGIFLIPKAYRLKLKKAQTEKRLASSKKKSLRCKRF